MTKPLVLKALRIRKNLTQIELGLLIGLTQSEISLIERGFAIPRPEILEAMRDELAIEGVSMQPEELLRPWDDMLLEMITR